jgi:malate dehydrogenase
MIPLTRLASYNGIPVSQFYQKGFAKVVADTMVGGATLTGLLGTSAWYAPGASVAYLVDSILNQKKDDCLFCFVEGNMVKTTFVLVFLVSLVKMGRRDRRYQIRRQ